MRPGPMPPKCLSYEAWKAVGSAEAMCRDHDSSALKKPIPARPDSLAELDVETAICRMRGYAASCSYARTPQGSISCQGWVIG